MLTAPLFGALIGLFGSSVMTLGMWRRAREIDDFGNPQLRYFGPRYSMPMIACITLAIGIYELNDPINYRYWGNLLILAYTPLALTVFIVIFAVYVSKYRIVLKRDTVEYISTWPSQSGQFSLKTVTGFTKPQGRNGKRYAVINFADGREFKINGLLSGQTYFYEKLNEALKIYGTY